MVQNKVVVNFANIDEYLKLGTGIEEAESDEEFEAKEE